MRKYRRRLENKIKTYRDRDEAERHFQMAEDGADRLGVDFPYDSVDEWLEATGRSIATENPGRQSMARETQAQKMARLEDELEAANEELDRLRNGNGDDEDDDDEGDEVEDEADEADDEDHEEDEEIDDMEAVDLILQSVADKYGVDIEYADANGNPITFSYTRGRKRKTKGETDYYEPK